MKNYMSEATFSFLEMLSFHASYSLIFIINQEMAFAIIYIIYWTIYKNKNY